MTYPAWINPPYLGANCTSYSADGFTMGCLSLGQWAQWNGATPLPAGAKTYFEITNTTSSSSTIMGVIWKYYQDNNVREYYPYVHNYAGVTEAANVYINGGSPGSVAVGASQGVTLGVAVDTTANLIWFCTSTSSGSPVWNGGGSANPATGAGGYDISSLTTSALVPFYSTTATATTTNAATLNVGGTSFLYGLPTGFAALGGTGWKTNSYQACGTFTLSNGGLTATSAISGTTIPCASFINSGASSGKYYCEWTGSQTTGSLVVGLAETTFNGDVGATTGVFSLGGDGNFYINATSAGALGSVGTSTMGMAIDLNANLGWFRLGSGNWNGSGTANPATGAGGIDISSLTKPVCPIGGQTIANFVVMALNTGQASYANAAPTGFGNWPFGPPASGGNHQPSICVCL